MLIERPSNLPAVGASSTIRSEIGQYTITGESDDVWSIQGVAAGVETIATLSYNGNTYHFASTAPIVMSGPRDGDWVAVLLLTL